MNPDITRAVLEFLMRWGHFLAGVAWIGLLYYFNFVQGEYFKEATPDAKADAVKKLAPRALWWFRYGALLTFLSGLVILVLRGHPTNGWSFDITIEALLGTLMFLNVWLIIWPNQKIVCGIVSGDASRPAQGAAGLAHQRAVLRPDADVHGLVLAPVARPARQRQLGGAVDRDRDHRGAPGQRDLRQLHKPMVMKGIIHCSIALAVVLWLIAGGETFAGGRVLHAPGCAARNGGHLFTNSVSRSAHLPRNRRPATGVDV
jgi:hypothetical protein